MQSIKPVLAVVFSFVVALLTVVALPQSASAAITESGPPILGYYGQSEAGGGSIITLAKFRLRGDGATALDKVGVYLRASSTMDTLTQIDGIAIYRESNNKHDFQFGADTFIAASYTANPATSTLLSLSLGDYVPVGDTDTEFYIVASTSATTNIINGNAFDITMDASYASTTGGTPLGIGSALVPMNKVVLSQSAPLLISEILHGGVGAPFDEFIEIYNKSEYAVDLSKLPLSLYIMDALGGAQKKTITYDKTIIPRFAYFLLAAQNFYSGSTEPDATYDASTGKSLVLNAAFSLATSTTLTNATSGAAHLLGYDG